jgi:hypothetical protein
MEADSSEEIGGRRPWLLSSARAHRRFAIGMLVAKVTGPSGRFEAPRWVRCRHSASWRF